MPQLTTDEFDFFEDFTEEYQSSFFTMPIEFLQAVDNIMYTGQIEPILKTFSPQIGTRYYYLLENLTKLFQLLEMKLRKWNFPNLHENVLSLLDILVPKIAYRNMN